MSTAAPPPGTGGMSGSASGGMTLRLPAVLRNDLETVARIEGVPASQVIREALTAYIQRRQADPVFQAKLVDDLARTRRLATERSTP